MHILSNEQFFIFPITSTKKGHKKHSINHSQKKKGKQTSPKLEEVHHTLKKHGIPKKINNRNQVRMEHRCSS